MAKLLFISGPLTGKYVSLDQQKTSFGRSPEADVVVADPEIEEVHFNVLREMAEYFVVDNNSTHGTLLDGARVKRAKIVHRSRIQFGKHVIVFFHDLTPGLSPAGGFDKAVKGTKESGSAEVRFIEGPVAGKRVSINATRTAFGRSKSCDVCLADAEKSISRHHFFIEREADKFYLIDNNSVNGTWLNGQKITRAELSDGDQIRVGPHLIRFALTKTEALPIASLSATEAARPSQETISLSSGGPRTSHVFVVRSLVDAVRSADYAAERLKIGRGPDCDVVLHDGYVARLHAIVERTSAGYLVTDNQTAEGTTVNGARIVTHLLRAGDVIRVGTYELRTEFIRGGLAFNLAHRGTKTEAIVLKGRTLLLKPPTVGLDATKGAAEALTAAIPLRAAATLDLQPPESKDSILDAYLRFESKDRRARPPRWVPTSDYEKPWRLKILLYSTGAAVATLGCIVALAGVHAFVPRSLSLSHLQGRPRPPITLKASEGSCLGCHTPAFGVDLGRCGSCHDARVSSKHAAARLNCLDCHTEHRGRDFRPRDVALSGCSKCHNGEYRFRDAPDVSFRVLPIPHGGQAMGYPLKDGKWASVSFKDGTALTKESFHIRHTAASVGCINCHSTVEEGKLDRETPRFTCVFCHGGRNSLPEGRITVRCTSCHAQHGDHREERVNAKPFSKLALQRPWQDPAGQDRRDKPYTDPPPPSKSSTGLLIAVLSLAGGVPLVLAGVVYFMTSAKRRAYIVGLAAATTSPPPARKEDEFGLNAVAVAEAERIIKKGDAALNGTVVLPAIASLTGPIPEELIPKSHPHPIVDVNLCVGCKACVEACPFNVFDLTNGKAVPARIAACMGDTVCAVVCPTYAIKIKGVDKVLQTGEMPDISESYETNVKGLYCIGDLTSLPLIKNAINMGKAVIDIVARTGPSGPGEYDVAIVGIGPAGLSATLSAQAGGLKYIALEQGETANTIRNYPRQKLVLGEPTSIPLYGPLQISDSLKEDLLEIWDRTIAESGVQIRTGQKVESVSGEEGNFRIKTPDNEYTAKKVILAIGTRGTPRRLGATGEQLPKVTYSLVEAAAFQHKHVLVVGGGDSAIEACLALAAQGTNTVSLSYRKEKFERAKSRNIAKIKEAIKTGAVNFIPDSNVKEIRERDLVLKTKEGEQVLTNDYVIILIGGEVPKPFLEKAGIRFARRPLTIA